MNKVSTKHFQLLVVAFVVVAVGVFALSKRDQLDFSSASAKSASVVINFGNGTSRMFEGEVTEKMTLLEALAAATSSGNIRLLYAVDQNNNAHISAIGEAINNTADKQWDFYVNRKLVVTKDVNKLLVSPQDQIEVIFE